MERLGREGIGTYVYVSACACRGSVKSPPAPNGSHGHCPLRVVCVVRAGGLKLAAAVLVSSLSRVFGERRGAAQRCPVGGMARPVQFSFSSFASFFPEMHMGRTKSSRKLAVRRHAGIDVGGRVFFLPGETAVDSDAPPPDGWAPRDTCVSASGEPAGGFPLILLPFNNQIRS